MSGVEVTHERGAVVVTVRVGKKTARLKVTPDYAKRLARDLITAALQAALAQPATEVQEEGWLERLERILGGKPVTAHYPRRLSATRRDPLGLTPRERQVAGMLCMALDGPAVARSLGCAYSTLRRHTKAVYRKLGVHSRAELVARLRAAEPALSEPFVREMSDDEHAFELDVRTKYSSMDRVS